MTLKKRVTEYFDSSESTESNPDEITCPDCDFKTIDPDEFEDHTKSHDSISKEFWNGNFNNFVKYQIDNIKKTKGVENLNLLMGKIASHEGKKIKGTLAYAGVSLNNRLYLPEELAKGDGKTLPLIVNHASTSGAEGELHRLPQEVREGLVNGEEIKVGEVKLSWNPEALTLYYEGEVEDTFFQKEIVEADMAVSLGMYYDVSSPQVCDKECYTVIKGGEFSEVSLVYHAGFPVATIESNEALLKEKAIEAIGPHTGDYDNIINDPNSNPTTSGKELPVMEPETKVAKTRMDENEIGVSSSSDLITDSDPSSPHYIPSAEEEVSGPPSNTVPTENNSHKKNVYKETFTTNNKIMSDEIDTKDQKADLKDEIQEPKTEEQANGVHADGGGGNCPEGQVWNAETESCTPVEGTVDRKAPSGTLGNGGVSDGGKSAERIARSTPRRTGSVNSDIASEKRRVKEYYKKLDRLEALRGMKVSESRIKAKEQYLKEKQLDKLIRSAKESAVPRAMVTKPTRKAGESFGKVKAEEKSVTGPARWYQAIKNEENVPNSFIWHVNKQGVFEGSDQRFIKEYDANENTKYVPMASNLKKAGEAITGPASNDFMRIMSEQVLVLPNGKVVTPIRQFCETKVLPTGTKEAFFYDFGAVTFGNITEDGSTVVGESTVAVRSAGGPASPRGTKLILGYTQIEESPIDLIASANRSFALESVNDESVEVMTTAFNDDVGSAGSATARKDKGGGAKANRWVDEAGVQITADASGLGNLTFAGLVSAKGVIEDEGLDPSNLVTYTTGKAIRDLVFDPDLDSFISFSRPAIITEATVERIAGTNVVRSSALASGSQSGSSRSCMFVPNIAFGLISGRDLTMEAQRRNELQSIFLTGTQRIAGFVKNVEATCRISHL
jgi:hypothetical protein